MSFRSRDFGWREAGSGAALLLSLGLFALLLGCRFLPMVDLPHHAVLVAIWRSFDDPFTGDAVYVPNFRTPYLLTYPLAYLLAPLLGVVSAFKLLTWLGIVGYAAGLGALARRLGHDPWLGLLGIPTGLSHIFYFGFITFLVTTALGLSCMNLALDYRRAPSLARGLLLGGLLSVTLLGHGMAFFITAAMIGPLLLTGGGSWWARLAPFAAPAALYAGWFLPGGATARIGADVVRWEGLQLIDLPASLLGQHRGDLLALGFGILVLALVWVAVGRFKRAPLELWPLVFTLGMFCFLPPALLGMDWLNQRFTNYVIPAFLIACLPLAAEQAGSFRSRPLLRGAIVLLCFTWMGIFGLRLAAFNRESAPFARFLERLPQGLAVRGIVFDRESPAFPGTAAFLHFPVYYQILKGGRQGYLFAGYPTSLIRFRTRGVIPQILPGLEWHPRWFSAAREIHDYDYFIVKSRFDRSAQLFADSPVPVVLDQREGEWWGYRPLQ
jgi:hypothetical protein